MLIKPIRNVIRMCNSFKQAIDQIYHVTFDNHYWDSQSERKIKSLGLRMNVIELTVMDYHTAMNGT